MRTSYGTALRVALTYAAAAALWIVVSGALTAMLPRPVGSYLEVAKGLAFVVVTSVALYWTVLKRTEQAESEFRHRLGAERLLTQVVETVPVGVALVNDEGQVSFMNPRAEVMLGTSATDSIGSRFEDLIGAGVSDMDRVRLADLWHTGVVDGIEIHAADTPRALGLRAAAIDGGNPSSGWIVAFTDTTESHAAGERVGRLLRSYRFLSEAAVIMMRAGDERQLMSELSHDAVDSGGFTAVWAVLSRHEGGGPEDVATFGMGERARDVAARIVRESVDSPTGGIVARLRAGEIIVSNDIARDPTSPWYPAAEAEDLRSACAIGAFTPNGARIVLTLFSDVPGFFDPDQLAMLRTLRNEIVFVIEKMQLERKRLEAEEALGSSEQGYRALFEANPQAMWVYDRVTLAFLAVNDAAIRKYGYSREEFLSMTIADIRPSEDIPRLRERISQVRGGVGFDDAGIWSHIDSRGRVFPVHIYTHDIEWEHAKAQLVMALEVARIE